MKGLFQFRHDREREGERLRDGAELQKKACTSLDRQSGTQAPFWESSRIVVSW